MPIALLVLVGTIHPQARQWLLQLGRFVFGLLLIAAIVVIAVAVSKYLKRRQQAEEALEAEVRVHTIPLSDSQAPFEPVPRAHYPHPHERYILPGAPRRSSSLNETLSRAETLLNSAPSALPARESASPKGPPRMPLVSKLRSIDWFQFEKLMEIVYRRQGYLVERRGGANPDGGIDLVITKAGQRIGVQCKHWKQQDIGVRIIRELVGAVAIEKLARGVLVTISDCTDDAEELAAQTRIEIVNHNALANLLEKLDVYNDREMQDLLTDTRKFCPKCEYQMKLRTTNSGQNAGRQFWGCSRYPACRHKEWFT
jgi:HJR/Mrr/RecB family endonuclease